MAKLRAKIKAKAKKVFKQENRSPLFWRTKRLTARIKDRRQLARAQRALLRKRLKRHYTNKLQKDHMRRKINRLRKQQVRRGISTKYKTFSFSHRRRRAVAQATANSTATGNSSKKIQIPVAIRTVKKVYGVYKPPKTSSKRMVAGKVSHKNHLKESYSAWKEHNYVHKRQQKKISREEKEMHFKEIQRQHLATIKERTLKNHKLRAQVASKNAQVSKLRHQLSRERAGYELSEKRRSSYWYRHRWDRRRRTFFGRRRRAMPSLRSRRRGTFLVGRRRSHVETKEPESSEAQLTSLKVGDKSLQDLVSSLPTVTP